MGFFKPGAAASLGLKKVSGGGNLKSIKEGIGSLPGTVSGLGGRRRRSAAAPNPTGSAPKPIGGVATSSGPAVPNPRKRNRRSPVSMRSKFREALTARRRR